MQKERKNEEMDAEKESSAFKRNSSRAENVFFTENQAPASFLRSPSGSKHS